MVKRNISRPKWLTEHVESFFAAILKLRNKEECRQFFRDILSVPEVKTFAMRWRVANMLHDGITYQDIEKTTGMSSTTIARISRWLEYGEGGYKLLIKRTRRKK
ncbi:MAG: YerC/YecD family TrpR-related protein [Patescibacteria group bacterium]|nr:hypothetical protein [Patescibacteria group bacterium]